MSVDLRTERAEQIEYLASHLLSRAALLVRLRSEEHTSELQSQSNLVCRLLLETKRKQTCHHKLAATCGAVIATHLCALRAAVNVSTLHSDGVPRGLTPLLTQQALRSVPSTLLR